MFKKNKMFIEINVWVNGEKRRADARKVFKYLLEDYSKVSYNGKVAEPYEERVAKFFDNIPDTLIQEWKKAYPNVDIKSECAKARAWLVSNTGKAKKDLKRFTNNWLAQAMNNGGKMPVQTDSVVERQIKEQRKYYKSMVDREDIATPEERKQMLMSAFKTKKRDK